jgi:uncharacterized protein (TIGR02453 family)
MACCSVPIIEEGSAVTRFSGFPAAGLAFLGELKENNDREWFQPRKEIFDREVRGPMEAAAAAVNEHLAEFAPEYVTPPAKAIYRIYRDTRFSADKTPYKTHIAAHFPHRALAKNECAGFYFSVSAEQIEVAGGAYMPGPPQLLAIRNQIAAHPDEFRTLAEQRRVVKLMGALQGDQLTRVPKGFAATHSAADYLRHKQWYYYVLLDSELATSARLLKEVVERFRRMAPFIDFLNKPLLQAARKAARAGVML